MAGLASIRASTLSWWQVRFVALTCSATLHVQPAGGEGFDVAAQRDESCAGHTRDTPADDCCVCAREEEALPSLQRKHTVIAHTIIFM